MLEKLHDHIVQERNNRTDTIILIVALIFNLIIIGVNQIRLSTIADTGIRTAICCLSSSWCERHINGIALVNLKNGRNPDKLIQGLKDMYETARWSSITTPRCCGAITAAIIQYMSILVVLLITSLPYR